MTRLFGCLQIDFDAWPARHPAEAMLLARAAARRASGAEVSDWPLGWEPRKQAKDSTGPRRQGASASARGG